MKTSRLIVAETLLLVALAACAERPPAWSGTITDSAGVAIVSNPDHGLWAPGEEWSVHEELRIGALEGPPEVTFGDVGGVAVDSRGRIYVLDSHAQEIRVFSPEGAFLHAVGGRGEGPGELQLAWAPVIGPGDTLFVPDGRLQRLNLFAPDGSSAGSSRWEVERGRSIAFRSTASGRVAEQIRPVWDPMEAPTEAEGLRDIIVLRSMDGTVADTILTFSSGEMMGPGGVRAFASEPKWDVEDGRLLFGSAHEYRIALYVDGRLQRVITRPFEPVPVSEADRSAVMREMERRWAEARVPAEMLARVRSRWSFADVYPAFQELAFGPEGTIWVQRVRRVSELDEAELLEWQNARSPEWDVFDGEGRYLGVVTMPGRFRLYGFRGGRAYGVIRGDRDEPYVLRLRVVRSAGDGETG